MEAARDLKTIGSALQAEIALDVDAETELGIMLRSLGERELQDAFSVSNVKICTELSSAVIKETVKLSDGNSVVISMKGDSGVKCARCWKMSSDTCSQSLCPRCRSVLFGDTKLSMPSAAHTRHSPSLS